MSTSFPPVDFSGAGGGGVSFPPVDFSGTSTPQAPHQDTSFLGFGKSLLHGAEALVTSVPSIVIRAATDPIGLSEDFVKSNYDIARHVALVPRAFANLAVGDTKDFHKFYGAYRNYFYSDPFANTLFILGGAKGVGGRLGALRELTGEGVVRAPTVAEITRAAVLGHDSPIATRVIQVGLGKDIPDVGQAGELLPTRRLGAGHFAANRAYMTDSLLKSLPASTPLLGEFKRAARATRSMGRVDYLRYISAPEYIKEQQTYRAMTKPEKTAVGLRNKLPFSDTVATWKQKLQELGTPEAELTLKQLNDPKIVKLYENASPRMLAHEAAASALEPLRTEIMVKHGALTPEQAAAAPWRHTRILRGAKLATPAWVYKQTRKVNAEIRSLGRQKGKLVPAAKAFARGDMRTAMKEASRISNEAIKESGYRGRLHGRRGDPELGSSMRVLDLTKNVDETFAQKEATRELLDMVASGEVDTNMLARFGIHIPEGTSLGRMEEAMLEATHRKLVGGHTDELKTILDQLKRARERRLSTRELDEMGLKIPSDLRTPTADELRQATEKRAYRDTLANNLKLRKGRLTEKESTRVKGLIDGLNQEIRDLENPRPIHRSPSATKRRFQSRYAMAEKKLMKRAELKRAEIQRIEERHRAMLERRGQVNPLEDARSKLREILEPRFRRDVGRYQRALAAEFGHGESIKRSLEIKERQAKSEQEIKRIRELRIQFAHAQRLRLADLNHSIEEMVGLRHDIEASRGELVGGGTPEELTREALAKGRPVPFYSPDEMLKQEPRRGRGAAEGSILAQRVRGDIYDNRSILLRTGLLALHPDTLGPAYFRAAKHDLNMSLHAIAMRAATKIAKDAPLPAGYEYLRRTRGETISETAKHKGEHMRALEDEYGREEDISTTSPDDKKIDYSEADGSTYRLIIPKSYADEFRAEGVGSRSFLGKITKKSMDVWRALILHLRVPWLVNNVLGNTFLFAMRFAGVAGLANFVRMTASNPLTRKFIPAMRRLALAHLDADQVRELFPEQVRGTHFETQAAELPSITPSAIRAPLEQSRAGVLGLQGVSEIPRLLPKLDKASERRLRRAATNQVLRSSPQVKAIYKEMQRQGSGSFHDAVTKAIENDPHFRGYVVQEVNDALGNFLSLTRSERSLLRQAVPFYAWMREITRLAGRMVVDHPGRVLLLDQLAKVSSELQAQDVPSYMRGTILADKTGWLRHLIPGAGGGLVAALALRSASPYATLADEAQGVAALLPGSSQYNVRSLAGNFNPAAAALYNVATASGQQGNLLSRYATELLRSLPQSQLIAPYPSSLYPDRTRVDTLAKIFAGSPYVRYDPSEADYQNFLGR